MIWMNRGRRVRSFAQDAAECGSLVQHAAGTAVVPLDLIVGSVGRAHELRADFLPVRKTVGYPRATRRHERVRRAMEEGVILPPLELYKLLDRYYVVDGHHRVAAARTIGQIEFDAVITEFHPLSLPGDVQ